MYRTKVIFLDKNDILIVRNNEGKEITKQCHNFMCSDIMNIIDAENLTDNPKIMYICEYNGTQEQKQQNISELINAFKDDNIVICTTAYVSTIEYPEEKYYFDSDPVDGKELLPIDEVLDRESLILELAGFINVNEYTGYEYSVAFIYPNEIGQKVIDIMLKEVEEQTFMNLIKMRLEELKQHKIEEIGFDPENYDECLEAVKQNGSSLAFIEKQTPEICLEAVKEWGYVLCYVNEQTPEICLEAVKQDGMSLRFIKEQTPEICLEAVKESGSALQFVKEQTEEMCLEAVKQNAYALQFVKEQTEEMCLEAVKQDGFNLQYVNEQTPEICLEAVKENAESLQLVKEQTYEICLSAVKQDGLSLKFVKEQTPEICLEAVKQNKYSLVYVKDLSMIISG